jgi:4-carboxymuconolactone decarboxylase
MHRTETIDYVIMIAGELETTARHWTAQYEWFAHEKMALDQGISNDVVEAIRNRRRPQFDEKKAVYELVTELYETKAVSDPTYGAAVQALGEQTVMELVTIATFYAMIAMFLVTFQVDIPGGATLPLPTG